MESDNILIFESSAHTVLFNVRMYVHMYFSKSGMLQAY